MKMDWYSKGLMLAALAATIGGGNVLLAQEGADAKPKVVEAKPADEAGPVVEVTERYWIGAKMAAEMPSLLKRHLPMLADKGVLVEGVFEGSPAADAGLVAEDVVLELNGQAMTDARVLVDAVREGKGEALKLVILHDGQETKLELTPRKMTKEDVMVIAQAQQQLLGGNLGSKIRIRSLGEGQLAPQGNPLPAMNIFDKSNGAVVKVKVTRNGDGPAKVHVEHNGKTYDVDADHLDELPAEIRPMVKSAANAGAFGGIGEMNIDPLLPHGQMDGMMQQQLQDIRRMLEEMKAQMRQGQPEAAPQDEEGDHAI